MQTILTATKQTGEQRRFHINIPMQHDEQHIAAAEFAGVGGTITESTRERLNDYVGSPVWSEETVIDAWKVR